MSEAYVPSSPERLAYWYFRLNGFTTTENFVLHPDDGGHRQRTDADLLAVRFKHRSELLARPLPDDPRVAECGALVNVIIAEIKRGDCRLNGPWTNRESENMRRVVRSIGAVPLEVEYEVCETLYENAKWSRGDISVRLFALGEKKTTSLLVPVDQQVTWGEIIGFCKDRFAEYSREKGDVQQWPADGKTLREAALSPDAESEIRKLFGLRKRVAA